MLSLRVQNLFLQSMNRERRIICCKQLWQEVFGDSDEYINHFISHYFCDRNMLSIESDEELLSMLHIVPFTYCNFKIGYIFAVATAPQARCRGYATKLIEKAVCRAKEEGYDALALIPADDRLYNYYTRFGFSGRHNVDFSLPDTFTFDTGDKELDLLSILPLSPTFTLNKEDSTIILKWNGDR